jgi:hypothetical protein
MRCTKSRTLALLVISLVATVSVAAGHRSSNRALSRAEAECLFGGQVSADMCCATVSACSFASGNCTYAQP